MKKLIYLIYIFIYMTTFSWSRCCGATAADCNLTIPPTYNEELVKSAIQKEFVGNREIVDGGLILKTQSNPDNILAHPVGIKSSISIKTITIFSFNDLNEGYFIAKINVPKDTPIEYIDYALKIKLNLTHFCKGGAVVAMGEGLDGKLYFNKNIINGCY